MTCDLALARQWCKEYDRSTCNANGTLNAIYELEPCLFDGFIDLKFLWYTFLRSWYSSSENRMLLPFMGVAGGIALGSNAACLFTFRRMAANGETMDANQVSVIVANTLCIVSVCWSHVQSEMVPVGKDDAWCLRLWAARVWSKTPATYYGSSLANVLLLVGVCAHRRGAIVDPIKFRSRSRAKSAVGNFVGSFLVAGTLAAFLTGNWPVLDWRYTGCPRHQELVRSDPTALRFDRFCFAVSKRKNRDYANCSFEFGRGIRCAGLEPHATNYTFSSSDAAFAKARGWRWNRGLCTDNGMPDGADGVFYALCVVAYAALLASAIRLLRSYRAFEKKRKDSQGHKAVKANGGAVGARTFTILLMVEISLSFTQFAVLFLYYAATYPTRFFAKDSVMQDLRKLEVPLLGLGAVATTAQLSGNLFFYLATSRSFRRHMAATFCQQTPASESPATQSTSMYKRTKM